MSMTLLCAGGTGMNREGGWRAGASAGCQLKQSTSSPASVQPPAVLLLHLWDSPLRGDPPFHHVLAGGDVTAGAAVQSGWRWQPQAQHQRNLRQHPGAGKPCSSQVWPRPASISSTGFPTRPWRKGMRNGSVHAVGWTQHRPTSPGKTWI